MKKQLGVRLSDTAIEQLKAIATRHTRSNANMLEVLIENEYRKLQDENAINQETTDCGCIYNIENQVDNGVYKIYFQFVNDNGEWEKTSLVCESLADAKLKERTINKSDRKRNPEIRYYEQ